MQLVEAGYLYNFTTLHYFAGAQWLMERQSKRYALSFISYAVSLMPVAADVEQVFGEYIVQTDGVN